jgi:hypothetical protein
MIFRIDVALALLVGFFALSLPRGLGVRGQMRK